MKYAVLVLLGSVALGATLLAASADRPRPVPQRILFIGDSFTGAEGGIWLHVAKLAESSREPIATKTEQVWIGGATLKRLWELGDSVRTIDTGSFDVVVLQDDIPETNLDYFRQYARMFVEEARQHRARPVLYMTWAYQRLGWISMEQIAEAHRALAAELNVDVAPVGLAWQRAHQERPDLDLFAADREHPSPLGMYLASCVVYATIYGRTPRGSKYLESGVRPQEATFLQEVAWKTLLAYRTANPR